jgi:M6 family metalloprotease-like protein
MRAPVLLGVLVISTGFGATALAGQDIELLGRMHGTRPPAAYYALIARDPTAFQFAHGRALRMRRELQLLARQTISGAPAPLLSLGPRNGVVKGTFHIPVILGLFSDSPAGSGPYSRDQIATTYFGGGPGTVTAYYSQVSGGLVTLEGDVQDWVRATLTAAQATGGQSGLVAGSVGPFIISLLQQLPNTIDWGQFDNDGPDGVPNSGDDDGYVDALAVIQPTYGAECTGNSNDSQHIWSHKWNLSDAAGQAFTTATPSANGGYIKIDDYFIQPVLDCNDVSLNPIGVFTHETGHSFGLPDLYDTRNPPGNQGDGNWDLMSTGNWGCNGSSPGTPCPMGGWSRSMLGWVTVTTIPDGTDMGTLTLPPVETSNTVYRVDTQDGSGEYFLLENRQRIGFDQYVPGTGMLVWDIDPTLVAQRWSANDVNGATHMAIRVRQADGRNDLGQAPPGGNRGDSGDPFPFVSGGTSNDVFHAESNPSSDSYGGSHTGVTLVDIQKAGQDVTTHLSTRFTQVTVTTQGDGGQGGLLTVDGELVATPSDTYTSAPFVPHEVDAAAGDSVSPGVRTPFAGWTDDSNALRQRSYVTPMTDTTLVASYSGTQWQLAMDVTGGINGVSPVVFITDPTAPDLWFTPGVTVSIQAQARTGFEFLGWTGVLAGQPNPATLVMDSPKQAGADFDLTYALSARTVDLVAAEDQVTDLQVENANAPVTWSIVSGQLPDGLTLAQTGKVVGAPLATGTFQVVVQAKDAIGLTASASLTLDVSEPVIPLNVLASSFLQVGPVPTQYQKKYLDIVGNDDGVYDLGDLRAWVLAHPGLPETAPAKAGVASPRVIRLRVTGGKSGGATDGGGGER